MKSKTIKKAVNMNLSFILGGIIILILAVLAILCLVFFIKTKRIRFILGFIGSIGAVIPVVIILFIIRIFGFFDSGIMRYAPAIMGQYSYTLHYYQYKTRDTGPRHGDLLSMEVENLCELVYYLSHSNTDSRIINDSGELTAIAGPPYAFAVEIKQLSKKVSAIKYNSMILETKSGDFDMFNAKIYSEAWYGRYFERLSDRRFFARNFKKTRSLEISPLRKGMEKILRKGANLPFNDPIPDDDTMNQRLDEYNISCTVAFSRMPIKIYENENVKVKVDISFIMADGTEERVTFEKVFDKYYYEIKTRSPVPLEKAPKLDDYYYK
jgi:Ca2+/Na+ antiporter